MPADFKVGIELTGDDTGAQRALSSLASQLDRVGVSAENIKLAESVATPADLAQAALLKLERAAERGEVSLEDYEDAARRVQASFGLITPEGERATRQMLELDRAFAKGEITADEYERELRQVGDALEEVRREGDGVNTSSNLLQGALQGIGMAAGQMALNVVQQAPRAALELVKTGAAAEQQEKALENLARSAGTSGAAITSAIQRASDHTVDRMTAMSVANRALVMDVAKTPLEFERLTGVAVALGRAMGMDATKAIDDFMTASARQSIMIADNLGLTISLEKANLNYARSIGKTADELTDAERKQAFLNEMLTQGEAKVAEIGETGDSTAVKIDKLTTAVEEAKLGFASLAVEVVEGTGGVDGFADRIRNLPTALKQSLGFLDAITYGLNEVGREGGSLIGIGERFQTGFTRGLHKAAMGMIEFRDVSQAMEISYLTGQTAAEEYTGAVDEQVHSYDRLSYLTGNASVSARDFAASEGEILHSVLNATRELQDQTEAVDEFLTGIDQAVTLRLSMDVTQQLASMEEQSKRFALRRETIEAEHQKRLEALQIRGQARAVRLNEEAEQEKLANLQYRYDQAKLKVEEMTGKERESSRIAKEHALAQAEAALNEQAQMLDDYHAGRLTKAGENVNALIDEENRRHEAAIAGLDAEMAKQEEIQKRALGNMTLQAFDAWTEQKKAMGTITDENIAKILEMRTSIAEEFGLVSEGATELVTDMVGEWDRWAQGMGVSSDEVVGYLGAVLTATEDEREALLDLTAQTYWIKIRYDLPDTRPEDLIPVQAHGGDAGAGTGGVVGDGGAAIEQGNPTFVSNDTININTASAAATWAERDRRDRRRVVGRNM